MNEKEKKIDNFTIIISIIVFGIMIIGFIKAPILVIAIILLYSIIDFFRKHSFCEKW